MSAQNKSVSSRFIEMLNEKNVSLLDDLLAENYVDHNPFPGQEPGREGIKQTLSRMLAAFPDLSVTVEDQIGSRPVKWCKSASSC